MHNTIAFSGGSRYGHTTSISFSSSCGSFESLNGHQMRLQAPRCPDPLHLRRGHAHFAAIVRTDQCVCPSGLELRVSSTISSLFDCGMTGLRPRSARTSPKRAKPSAVSRARHDLTVPGLVPATSAIDFMANPSAAINNTFAR